MDQTPFIIVFSMGFAFGIFVCGIIWHVYNLSGPVPPEWGPPRGVSSSDSVVPPVHVAIPARTDIAPQAPRPSSVGSTPCFEIPDDEVPEYWRVVCERAMIEEATAVIIISCSDRSLWYSDKIGLIRAVLGLVAVDGWKVLQPEGYINFVRVCDAVPVKMRGA